VAAEQGRLVGVIAEPVQAPASRCCTLVANTLAFRHTGPGRLNVQAARQAAARGFSSARFDLPGIGDSAGPSLRILDRTDADLADAVAALAKIAEHISDRGLAERFVSTGICSGGLLALRAAAADARVLGVTAINPPALASAGAPLRATRRGAVAYEHAQTPSRHRHRNATTLRARLAEVQVLWRLAHWPESRAAARDLDRLAALDASVLLVLSRQEPLARMLSAPRLAAKLRGAGNLTVRYLETGDHFVRAPAAQELVLSALLDHLTELQSNATRTGAEAP
jgi:alpha-beta hydrolase superfamily lysophospholipase